MKIDKAPSRSLSGSRPRGIDKVMKEIIYGTNALTVLCLIYLGASLVPGDKIGFNVVGTIGMVIMILIFNCIITVPLTMWRKRIRHGR